MAVGIYDTALVKKLSNWIKDPNLRILKPDEATRLFEMKFDETKDRPLTLPLVSISRNRDIEILNTSKQAKTFDGFKIYSDEKITQTLNVIPIQIGYQIDIYTKGMEEADEYVRNFVFNFINYPKLTVNFSYNGNELTHNSNIILDSNITDNSEIKEHMFADEFVRFTLKIEINDAYLFSISSKENCQLIPDDVKVENPDNANDYIIEEIK